MFISPKHAKTSAAQAEQPVHAKPFNMGGKMFAGFLPGSGSSLQGRVTIVKEKILLAVGKILN